MHTASTTTQTTASYLKALNADKDTAYYATKLDIISRLYHQWDIKHLKQAGILDNCYLLNWTPSYFIQFLSAGDLATLDQNGISYTVKYCQYYTMDDYQQARKVALSFRHCAELGIAVVLVKLIF